MGLQNSDMEEDKGLTYRRLGPLTTRDALEADVRQTGEDIEYVVYGGRSQINLNYLNALKASEGFHQYSMLKNGERAVLMRLTKKKKEKK